MTVAAWIARIDRLVWGPGMLALLMGTGVFLTLRTRFLPWRNLGWALKSVLGRGSRAKAGGGPAGAVDPGLHDGNGQAQSGQGFELAADGSDGGAAGGNNGNMIHKYVSSLNVVRWIQERDDASRMPTISERFFIKLPG